MRTFYQIRNFLSDKEFRFFSILLIFYFFSSIVEVLSISLIPVFIAIVVDRKIFEQLIQNFEFLDLSFLLNFTTKELLIYSASMIIFFFIFKNFYMILLYYFQNYFNYKVVVNKSNILFSNYIENDFSFHLNKNSTNLVKNLTQEVQVSIGYLQILLDF
mgnify:FL=1